MRKIADLSDDELKQYYNLKSYNVKMAYHVLRLLDVTQQIIIENDIDLTRNSAECKLMKNGLWGNFERFDKEFQKRLDYIDELSRKCTLPIQPQNDSLRKLLKDITEAYYINEENSKQQYELISTTDVMTELQDIKKSLYRLNRLHPEDDGK